jgi:amidase
VIGDELDAPKVTIVPIENDHAILPGNVRVPLNPMVGVIGVAPAGEAISCGTPDSHGGNMDCKMITAGSTLWLPVNVPGALFGLGIYTPRWAMAKSRSAVWKSPAKCWSN